MEILILDEPGKPGNAEVVDWDADHADIKWTKPESDGGSPITGYIIEYKVRLVFALNAFFVFLILKEMLRVVYNMRYEFTTVD